MLALLVALLVRCRQQSCDKRLLHGLQDDLRDNILNYDEQGGGEEDQVRGPGWLTSAGGSPQGPQLASRLPTLTPTRSVRPFSGCL